MNNPGFMLREFCAEGKAGQHGHGRQRQNGSGEQRESQRQCHRPENFSLDALHGVKRDERGQ